MKSSQSNFKLRSPGSYLVRSYLIATVKMKNKNATKNPKKVLLKLLLSRAKNISFEEHF